MARASRHAAAAAFAATFCLLWLPVVGGYSYYARDLSLYEGGLLCDTKAQLQRGEGLLVSRALGNGEPLAADPQSQVFYPPWWLQVLLPLKWALSLGPVLHLALAAAGAAWLARTFRIGPRAASLAGTSFAFCGTALDLIAHANYVVGAAYLPVAWAAGRRLLGQGPSPASVTLLVAALAGTVLGGEPQSFCVAAGVLVIEALLRWRWGPVVRRRLLVAAAALAAAVLVSAPTWLPAAEELTLSPRFNAHLMSGELLRWSFEPADWLGVLLPGVLLAPLAAGQDLLSVLNTERSALPWDTTPYVGGVAIILFFLALPSRRLRSAVVTALVGTIAALGNQTPLLPWAMRLFPPLQLFRYPSKYLTITSLALIVAAVGAAREVHRRRHLFIAVAAIVATAASAWCIAIYLAADRIDAAIAQGATSVVPTRPTVSSVLLHGLSRLAAIAIVALALAAVGRWKGRLLPALMAWDLIWAAADEIDLQPSVLEWTSPLVALPPESVTCGRTSDFLRMMSVDLAGGQWPDLMSYRLIAGPNLNACDGIVAGTTYSALTTRMQEWLEGAEAKGVVAAARDLGCTHIVTTDAHVLGPAEPVSLSLPAERWTRHPARIFAIADPIPESFIARAPVFHRSEHTLRVALEHAKTAEKGIDQIDTPGSPTPLPLSTSSRAQATQVAWTSRDHAEVTVEGNGPAVVGIRTSFHVGWTAEQAGRAVPVVRSAGDLLAAVVDDVSAGPVVFQYRLPLGRLSFALALLGGLLTAGLIASSRRDARGWH